LRFSIRRSMLIGPAPPTIARMKPPTMARCSRLVVSCRWNSKPSNPTGLCASPACRSAQLDSQWKRESDGRPKRPVVGRPQPTPVRFDDRSADGEAHAHPALLGSEERLESALCLLEALPSVGNFDTNSIWTVTA